MKYKIANSKPTPRIPQVGDLWRHAGSSTAYLRITDVDGRNALPNSNNDLFFSVNVSTGYVASTTILDFDGEVLKLRDETLVPA